MNPEIEYILRILLAAALGFAVGFERKMRYKEAGIRTHTIVAIGACLIMLVSKYGFSDINEYDSSRVAAQIVSGIGFLGAGMILYKREALSGLTTAAGIWATAGVGMCVGAGMYILSVTSTLLIIILQCILHLPLKLFRTKEVQLIRVRFTCDGDENEQVKRIFGVQRFVKINMTRTETGRECIAYIRVTGNFDMQRIKAAFDECPFIRSIERSLDE